MRGYFRIAFCESGDGSAIQEHDEGLLHTPLRDTFGAATAYFLGESMVSSRLLLSSLAKVAPQTSPYSRGWTLDDGVPPPSKP